MKRTLTGYVSFFVFLAFMILAQSAGAFDSYSALPEGCVDCHGAFLNAPYNSLAAVKAANKQWTGGLHNTHRNSSTSVPPGMLNSNCNACHSGTSRTPVLTGFSAGVAPFNFSCSGCHDGPGLRAHHRNSLAHSCGSTSCHSGDPAPEPENVLRPVYAAAFGTTSGTTRVNDPCDPVAAGFEGRLADVVTLGLDNDGNLQYDAADPACAPADTTPPTVTAFTPPATSSSLVVPIGAARFVATDNVKVTGYKVTTTATKPLATAAGWTALPTKNITFLTAGTKTLRAWAKDAAGNVSAAKSATVVITLTDLVSPTVNVFTLGVPVGRTFPITAFTASDNVKVTGYKLTTTPKAPLAGAAGWTALPPTSFTFKAAGTQTLFAWAKDRAGHVSTSLSVTVTVP